MESSEDSFDFDEEGELPIFAVQISKDIQNTSEILA